MEDEKQKIKKVCVICGSEDVWGDAYAKWDTDKQQWELLSVYDKGHYCYNCDGECRIIDKPLNP